MKLKIILTILSLSSVATAQQAGIRTDTPPGSNEPSPASDSGPELLTGPGGFVKHSGWYLAPTFGVTQIRDEASAVFGMRGAWRINKTLGIGLAATGIETGNLMRSDERTEIGYGGALVEYIVKSDSLAHMVVNLMVGGGAWCADENRFDCDDPYEFFVAQPTTNLELNVASFMRVSVGAGYRLAVASEHEGVGSSELSGLVAQTALEFGNF